MLIPSYSAFLRFSDFAWRATVLFAWQTHDIHAIFGSIFPNAAFNISLRENQAGERCSPLRCNSAKIYGKQTNAKRDVVFLQSRNCTAPLHYLISTNSRKKFSARLWEKGLRAYLSFHYHSACVIFSDFAYDCGVL